ncbi:uncharacterized protein LOC130998494 [Salvia miltiorrhiza]|uniref:uncharacterized protein LOC130998494 n=1 Tax=Salvia miltiorrhiza TaxID=226208 RepID=UPI0025ACBFDB|nr:uncharacterized protein LOC130998494 [Salvia miltiorrhiza]
MQQQLASIMREVQQLKMDKMENSAPVQNLALPMKTPPMPAQLNPVLPMSATPNPALQYVEPCGICGDFSHGANECHRMREFTPEGQAEVYAAQGFQSYNQVHSRPYGQNMNQGPQNIVGGWRGAFSTIQTTIPTAAIHCATECAADSTTEIHARRNAASLYGDQQTKYGVPSFYNQKAGNNGWTTFRGKMVDNKVDVPAQTRAEQPSSAFTRAEQPSSTFTRAEQPSSALTSPTDGEKADQQKEGEKEKEVKLHKATTPYRPPVPFPNRLRNEKQDRQFEEFYNMLAKVNVNLPFLDVIRNVPAYVKFFKELASNKRRITLTLGLAQLGSAFQL